jgi:hypothetical protein
MALVKQPRVATTAPRCLDRADGIVRQGGRQSGEGLQTRRRLLATGKFPNHGERHIAATPRKATGQGVDTPRNDLGHSKRVT